MLRNEEPNMNTFYEISHLRVGFSQVNRTSHISIQVFGTEPEPNKDIKLKEKYKIFFFNQILKTQK
jgi:hypothetical protein